MNDFVSQDRRNMQSFGFIYADGSYSDERLPKGATLVPRRPSPAHKWDMANKQWVTTDATPAPVKQLVTAPVPATDHPAVQPDSDMSPLVVGMLASTTTPESE